MALLSNGIRKLDNTKAKLINIVKFLAHKQRVLKETTQTTLLKLWPYCALLVFRILLISISGIYSQFTVMNMHR
jgi:hypothetical protein